jgi:uncharacterized cupin superfamily protein
MGNIDSIIVFGESSYEVVEHPTAAVKCIKGQPVQIYKNYYKSPDKNLSAGIWSCEVGAFKVNFTEHEYIHMIKGKILIKDHENSELVLNAGMSILIPAGFQGTWEIVEEATKLFVNYEMLTGSQVAGGATV